MALDDGIGSVVEAPPELVALFEHLDTEPVWLDWKRVERGARVLRRYGVDAFYYFGLISLDGYRTEMIYKPLVLTGTYTGGTAFGRYLETCRFWLDISEPDGLRPGGAGRKAAVTVRVMHSMIRRKVARQWRHMRRQQRLEIGPDARGNVPDLLATLTSCETSPARAAQSKDAIRHLWDTLNATERQMLDLRLSGHTTAEIAVAVGLGAIALRVRLSRLRKRLIEAGVLDDLL